ncbi:hypothetical protein C8J57DRAFT_1326398 [Mycena rebaudengoi]|nr:hypothetical protein C8J57DRAFT_1326398 [Mycena rebaudengoi]
MLFRSLVVSSLALAASAACLSSLLIQQSGGIRGVPLFCAYAPNEEVKCFYQWTLGTVILGASDVRCPTTAPLQDSC